MLIINLIIIISYSSISALLYSLIMVIAGVFSGIIIDDMIITVVDYFLLVCLFFYFIPLNTLLWSLFKAILLNDIKSIIALFIISQISYMFIALLINHILCFYHIIIHSLFKSNQYIYMFILLFFLLLLCFLLNSLIIPFICYEYLIILLFFILFKERLRNERLKTKKFNFKRNNQESKPN